MQLDAFTIVVAAGASVVLLAAQQILLWLTDRKSPWLIWFACANILGAVAIGLFALRGSASALVSIGLSNAVMLTVFAIIWQAVRIFEHRPLLLMPTLMVPAAWLLLYSVPDFAQSSMLRVVASSAGLGMFTLLSAYELWRGRVEKLPSRMSAVAVFGSLGLFFLVRIPLAPYAPFPLGALSLDPVWLASWVLVAMAHVFLMGMLMVAITKERREAEQREFALSDSLTGLLNRRALSAQMERMSGRMSEADQVALMVLDLDNFKQINDRFGHHVGDRLLVAFASVARSSLRATDLMYRMGGEEFCFLLPGAGAQDAFRVAETLRRAFEASIVDVQGALARTTVSIGIATASGTAIDLEALHAQADYAVYEAKEKGRNRVVVAGSGAIPFRPREIARRVAI